MKSKKPKGYEDYLGPLEWVKGSQEVPYAWGWKITKHMGDEKFEELRKLPEVIELYCAGYPEGSFGYGHAIWYAITKQLTSGEYIEALIKKHGAITKVKVGPRGGFQYVQFGKRDIWDSYADPTRGVYNPETNTTDYPDWYIDKNDPIVKWDEPTPAMKKRAQINARKKAAKEKAKQKKAIAAGKLDQEAVMGVIQDALKKKFGLEPVELVDGVHKKVYFVTQGPTLNLFSYSKGKSNFNLYLERE